MPESTSTPISSIISLLIDALSQPHVEDRWNAAHQLVEYGEAVVAPLCERFPAVNWSIQHVIVWVVGEVRSPAAQEFLIKALSSPNLHIQLSAARALEKLKTPESIAALEQWAQLNRL